MPAFWAGIDSGKRAHHCVVIDQAGTVLFSKRVENDETALLELVATVAEIAAGDEVCWATDLNAGGAALLIELLAAHAQQLLYIPGRIVHHAAATYRGDGKTDVLTELTGPTPENRRRRRLASARFCSHGQRRARSGDTVRFSGAAVGCAEGHRGSLRTVSAG